MFRRVKVPLVLGWRESYPKTGVTTRWVWKQTGQSVSREAEFEGHEEKHRAVIKEGNLGDEPVGQRRGKVEPALWRRKRNPFTRRTKVCADGTERKNNE